MADAEAGSDGVIHVTTEFSERNLIKSVPGARWDPKAKLWYTPLTWSACLALRGVFGASLSVGPKLAAWARAELDSRVLPAVALRTATSVDVAYHPRLFPFQQAGVAWAVTAESGLLGDDMGTGKTAQLIVTTRTNHATRAPAFPVLVVCPNTVKENWKREWVGPTTIPGVEDGWDPSASVFVVGGGAAGRRKILDEATEAIEAGEDVVVVINIEAVRLHSRLAPFGGVALRRCEEHGGLDPDVTPAKCEIHEGELNAIPFRTVIVDEAHRMKNARSKQTRAIWATQHGEDVKYRYSATGTPIANHMGDLWPIMHGVAPDEYPTKTKWESRFCLQTWNPFGGLDIAGVRPDTSEEFYRFFDPRYRRMSKALVLKDLPEKVRSVRYVEMKPKQRKAYRDVAEQLVTRLDDGSVVMATNNLVRNTRLLQFASAYAEVDAETGDVLLSEPSPKLDALEEIIGEAEGRAIVVAAESRQLIELAASRLDKSGVTYGLVTGAVTGPERDAYIADFQAGKLQVMLMTLKAGGVGITLTAADTMVFLQRSWSMIDNRQGEDRVHRIGSERHDSVQIIDMITAGTIEETQIPKLHAKLRRLQELQRDVDVARANGDAALVAQLESEFGELADEPLWSDDERSLEKEIA